MLQGVNKSGIDLGYSGMTPEELSKPYNLEFSATSGSSRFLWFEGVVNEDLEGIPRFL